MNKILIAALAASTALIAVPASAQTVSGTVALTGTVASKCTANPNNLNGSINLGELAVAAGTVNTAFTGNVGGLSRSFTVTCTSPNAVLSADASPLVNAGIVSPTAGYTNTVHYTATLAAVKAAGGTVSAADTSNTSGATTAPIAGHLANSANNVTVTVSSGNTASADLLEAGSYAGSIAISVAPAV